jgi:ActR/RegA family two-component response regulator
MMEEEILDELGCTIFGSTNHLAEAFGMVRESLPDAAILDFSIGDEKSLELAHYLSERNVPIVLVTGYAAYQATRVRAHYRPRLEPLRGLPS